MKAVVVGGTGATGQATTGFSSLRVPLFPAFNNRSQSSPRSPRLRGQVRLLKPRPPLQVESCLASCWTVHSGTASLAWLAERWTCPMDTRCSWSSVKLPHPLTKLPDSYFKGWNGRGRAQQSCSSASSTWTTWRLRGRAPLKARMWSSARLAPRGGRLAAPRILSGYCSSLPSLASGPLDELLHLKPHAHASAWSCN